MFNPSKRSLLGLVFCTGMVGAMAATSASPASAAPAAVTVNATLQTQTLKVTGSHFAPGSKVAIALVNTRTWKMVATGSTYAQFAIRQCSWTIRDCSEPNPAAGTISYVMHLKHLFKASNLHVLYRSAGLTGSHAVRAVAQTPSRCNKGELDCLPTS
jgi:hypothetical protein